MTNLVRQLAENFNIGKFKATVILQPWKVGLFGRPASVLSDVR